MRKTFQREKFLILLIGHKTFHNQNFPHFYELHKDYYMSVVQSDHTSIIMHVLSYFTLVVNVDHCNSRNIYKLSSSKYLSGIASKGKVKSSPVKHGLIKVCIINFSHFY